MCCYSCRFVTALDLSQLIDNNKQIQPLYSKEHQAKFDAIEDIALKLLGTQVTNDTLGTIRHWVQELDETIWWKHDVLSDDKEIQMQI